MNYSKPGQEVQRKRANDAYRNIMSTMRRVAESDTTADHDAVYGLDHDSITRAIGVALGDTRFSRRRIEW